MDNVKKSAKTFIKTCLNTRCAEYKKEKDVKTPDICTCGRYTLTKRSMTRNMPHTFGAKTAREPAFNGRRIYMEFFE